ncbi:MAG: phosphate ABC transporter substrate-binding protein [Thermodesulfobacteriota bacterium]
MAATMKRWGWRLAGMTVGAAMLLVTGSGQAADLTWTGCGITKNAFMDEIAKAYEAKTGTKIVLSGGGATKGIRSASAGTSDMGGTCRHWLYDAAGQKHPEEKDAVLVQVAWDAIVVVVHPDNPVSDISTANLKKVVDGQITSWKELGGEDKRIAFIDREGKESGVGHMFRRLVFGDPNYDFKARSLEVKASGAVEEKVEKTGTGLGLDGVSSAKKQAVKILSLDGVAPSKENIASGTYPLFRPLYITHHTNPAEEVQKALAFMLSPEGQAIISQQGTVNLEEGKTIAALWEQKKKDLGL